MSAQLANSTSGLREVYLVKLALSIDAGLEGATHCHTRRSFEQGLNDNEICQVTLLGVTTLGLSSAVRGCTWINDVQETEIFSYGSSTRDCL